jgi:hypothetical protein
MALQVVKIMAVELGENQEWLLKQVANYTKVSLN